MNPESVKAFLSALGATPDYQGGDWVKSDCVFAPFLHKSGKDAHPSFAVNIGEVRPFYHCFTCQSGSLEEMLGSLELHVKSHPQYVHRYNFKLARQILDDLDANLALPDYESVEASQKEFEEWPAYFPDSFIAATYNKDAMAYLQSRGVTLEQVKRHQIKFDTQRKMVCFPYQNVFGKLAGMRGRSIVEGAKYRHHDYTWNKINNASLVWYNEPVLQNDCAVVVVEGQFDALHVEKVYPNVIANMTAKPSPAKKKRLLMAPCVVLMLDNDPTGWAARDKWVEYLDKNNVKTAVITIPVDKKDPAECDLPWLAKQLEGLDSI